MTSPPQLKRIPKGSHSVIYVVHNAWITIRQLANLTFHYSDMNWKRKYENTVVNI